MKIGSRSLKHLSWSLTLAALVAGCGGAPNAGSGSNNRSSNSAGALVDISLVPTSVSLSMAFDTPSTGTTDGVTVSVQVILSNLVGNEPFNGQLVEFVAGTGVIASSCMVDGSSSCSTTWTSAANARSILNIPGTVAILAMVPGGAEPFVDINGNGLYDQGEVLVVDYAEPYLDDNFSGSWEVGEFFLDQNNDGMWNPANGTWDGPCSFTSIECSTPDGVTLFQTVVYPLTDDDGEFLIQMPES